MTGKKTMTNLREEILDLSRQARLAPLSPWFMAELDRQIERGLYLDGEALEQVTDKLTADLAAYRDQTGASTAVLGMSGGVDSALTAALLKRAGWRVVGHTLPIDQNPEETERGVEACSALDIEHRHLDLTDQYRAMVTALGGLDERMTSGDDEGVRIRRGNIRARLRMVTLYDQAHRYGGLVVSTDNLSELAAGFWTLHGDVGDLAPVQSLLKSWEVPWMARAVGVPERTWRAMPTDGLGITGGGDEAQIGSSYLEWDLMVFAILQAVFENPGAGPEELPDLLGFKGDDHAAGVLQTALKRLGRTWFKRLSPVRLDHPKGDRFGPLDALDVRLFRPAVLRQNEQPVGFPADLHHMAQRLVTALQRRGDKLVTAESCTAGLIGASLAACSGASDVFAGGYATYRMDMKTAALGVPAELLKEKTPYHPEVAISMATGALERTGPATIAIAVTGVAGPGPDCGKPQGLVYIAVARRGQEPIVEEHRFTGPPQEVLSKTIRTSLTMAFRQFCEADGTS
ncbi:NAD(+) synthase [Indioceanicola profundi]|uniref:NAD(+) synthase n=1 Tax=Indioceanicola profundi TaxID=2220096 RepID=UPI0019697739|nr:NAD(+) synthase [Indioceanicola profundi]